MNRILAYLFLIGFVLAQNPEIRQYKREIKTATGKEKVDAINNLMSWRGSRPEFHDENRKLILEAISLADSLKYAQGRVNAWLSMSDLYSNTDSIKKYVEKADLVSDAIGYQHGMAQVLRKYAGLDFKKKDYISALEKAKKAEAIYQIINQETNFHFVDWQSACLSQISSIYGTMGDISTALDYNLKAMAVFSDNKSHSGYRGAKNTAAIRYRALERHRKSLLLSLELIDESLTYGDSTNFSNGLYQASVAYRKLGVLDSAVFYSQKVLALDIELNNHDFILSDYSLIGDVFYEMEEMDSALAMYEKTAEMGATNKHISPNTKKNFLSANNISLGAVYLKQGKISLSQSFLEKGLQQSKEWNYKPIIQSAHGVLYELYEKKNNYQKTLEHYKAYIAYKDTLSGQEAQNKLANLEIQKEVSRSENERAVLEQKARIQDLEISKQKTIRNAFASVAVLIIALGWALLHNIRVRNKVLEEENKRKQEELDAALQLQLSMLPKENPETDSYISAASMNVAETVGGDYYDFFPQKDGSVYIICGDATGHGMAAGMVVSMTKTGLQTITRESPINFLGS